MTAPDADEVCSVLGNALRTTRTRRDLIAALGKTAIGAGVLASVGGPSLVRQAAADVKPVTAFVFGGAWRRAIAEAAGTPFTQQTGIPVRYQEPYVWAKLRAMHEAKAQQVDCCSVQGTEAILTSRLKIAAPLDWNVIDRSVLHPRQLTKQDVIGTHSLSMVLAYNKKTWPGADHPKSWADFWNVEKYPGRRAMRREAVWALEVALLADGATEDSFYPLDVDRGFKSLDRIKSHVKVWTSDNSQAQALMEREEVDMISVMDGRASETIATNAAPFEIVWNQQVSTGNGQGWIVVSGAPNPEGAMKFLNVVGRAETLATFARLLYYAPLNLKAYDLLDPEFAKRLSSYPANEINVHRVNYDWWSDNLAAMQRRFERWVQV